MNYQELTEDLAKYRRLLIRGDVTPEKQDILCTAMLLLDLQSEEPIRIDIDSKGGSANAARFLTDAIRAARSPVHGVVVGIACSSAFTILQTCDLRLALPNARVLFHGVKSEVRWDSPNMKYEIAHGRRLHEQNIADIAARSGQPINLLRRWSRDERMFDADEALKLGLIDRIEYPNPKTLRP